VPRRTAGAFADSLILVLGERAGGSATLTFDRNVLRLSDRAA
jgi:predicted nucleic-acid-binding protein